MIKTITLWQPWASAMPLGLKHIETRSWSTKHRGLLAIHASARKPATADRHLSCRLNAMPLGAVLGVVDLYDVVEMTPEVIAATPQHEKDWGIWTPGRFAWMTRPVVWFPVPVPAKGAQGLWRWVVDDDAYDRACRGVA